VAGGVKHEDVVASVLPLLGMMQGEGAPLNRAAFKPTVSRSSYVGAEINTPTLHLFFPNSTSFIESSNLAYAADILGFPRLGLLQQKLRGEERSIYNLSVSVEDWPFPKFTVDVPAPRSSFAHIEEETMKGIERVIQNDYAEELFQAIKTENRISFATRAEERTRGGWTDLLKDLWLEGDLEDLNIESMVMQTTREDIARTAQKYLGRENYGAFHYLPQEEFDPVTVKNFVSIENV
jgi:hypothetical protein